MTVRKDIKEEIIKRMDSIPDEMLLELLDFVFRYLERYGGGFIR